MLPDYLEDTRDVREQDWQVAPLPESLMDRRVEITGPVERKTMVEAMNSGARVFMADCEDALSPTWDNVLSGQRNLRDAVRRSLSFTDDDGLIHEVSHASAILMMRPRGLHLVEKHLAAEGHPLSASLVDLGLFLFHNAKVQRQRGSGPYVYLPKLESFLEARWWNDILGEIERELDLPEGSVKVTALIETLPAGFQMHEILYELRDRIVALNCGRWDYMFSYIKVLQAHDRFVLPDREQVTMDRDFLRAYSKLLINTCHCRGAVAMGGMTAQIPISEDATANWAAVDRVIVDKRREAVDGHDGTWVAHPGLVPVAMQVFNEIMPGSNQLALRTQFTPGQAELLQPHDGEITRAGWQGNVRIAMNYLAHWLSGQGCVPMNHLMEDAATAEIARAQVWQWLRYPMPGEERLDPTAVRQWMQRCEEELAAGPMEASVGPAARLLESLVFDDRFTEFLTVPAYDLLD